jgi:DNA-binding response OmpR family regulator
VNAELRQASGEAGAPCILVIEDDEGFADVLFRTLRTSGYAITVSARGVPALEEVRSGEYRLVLLDLLLPDIDGMTLLKRMMSIKPDQQVLVVSALSNVEAKVRCLELGAADYLSKPFALEEFAARVMARVRAGESHASDRVLSDGTVTLDLQRRLALVEGRAVPLSTREFFVLEHLMRREGEVCTRKTLLQDVWGYAFDPGTNIVDVYVRRLRQKLGDEKIETIRNVGYSFVAT